MKLLLLMLVLAGACTSSRQEDEASAEASALSSCIVLSQKALTYQVDFDTTAWASMLAGRVFFSTPNGKAAWLPKDDVVAIWKRWWQTTGVTHIRLSGFNHSPLSNEPIPLTDRQGMCITSCCTADLLLSNGRRTRRRMRLYCHFNQTHHIDGYLLSYQPLTLNST